MPKAFSSLDEIDLFMDEFEERIAIMWEGDGCRYSPYLYEEILAGQHGYTSSEALRYDISKQREQLEYEQSIT